VLSVYSGTIWTDVSRNHRIGWWIKSRSAMDRRYLWPPTAPYLAK